MFGERSKGVTSAECSVQGLAHLLQSAGGSYHHHHCYCHAHLRGGRGGQAAGWLVKQVKPGSRSGSARPGLSFLSWTRRGEQVLLRAPPDSGPSPPAVPGQREPDRKGVAVELGAGRAALVRAALQEGVLVAVQVVHQVAVAAVLGDDVDGPCRRTGSATVPGQEVGWGQASGQSHEADDRLHVGQQTGSGPWIFLAVSKAISLSLTILIYQMGLVILTPKYLMSIHDIMPLVSSAQCLANCKHRVSCC